MSASVDRGPEPVREPDQLGGPQNAGGPEPVAGADPIGRVTGRASVPVQPAKRSASPQRKTKSGNNGGPGRPNGSTTYRGKRKPRWGRILLVSTVVLAVLAGAAFGGLALYGKYL